jgi:hypothetical protein
MLAELAQLVLALGWRRDVIDVHEQHDGQRAGYQRHR